MAEHGRNVVVGSFVIVAIAAFLGLAILFGATPGLLRPATYDVRILFDSASGIRVGNPVEVAGKTIGYVQQVTFADPNDLRRGVVVVAGVNLGVQLPVDSYAVSSGAGLLAGGRPPVVVEPGRSNEMVPAGGVIQGQLLAAIDALVPPETRVAFERTALRIGDAAAALTPVLENLETLLERRRLADVDADRVPGNIATAADRLDELIAAINTALGGQAGALEFREVLTNLNQLSENGAAAAAEIRAAAADARKVVAQTGALANEATVAATTARQQIEAVGRSVVARLDETERVLDNLRRATQPAADGEGTVGRLLHDPRLYEALVLTAERLNVLLQEAVILIKDWQENGIRTRF